MTAPRDAIPLAKDDLGNVLYRIKPDWRENSGEDLTLELYHKEIFVGEMHFGADWESGTPQIWQADIEEGDFPTDWIVWIIYELYRVPITEFISIGTGVNNLLPVVVPNETWEDMAVREANSDIQSLTQTILKTPLPPDRGFKSIVECLRRTQRTPQWKGLPSISSSGEGTQAGLRLGASAAEPPRDVADWNSRNLAKAELKQQIEEILVEFGADPLRLKPVALFADIGRWQLKVGDYLVGLDVYHQKQPEGSPTASRIAYELTWKTLGSLDGNLSRFDLLDVLRDSGLWYEEDAFKDWIKDNAVDPVWLIDPDLFETYDLLDTKWPVFWPFEEFKIWLEAASQ